ncbi:MAG: transporter ATP-binding protein [Ferruginibacter sp.]|nr:transporter ATP-binding protein [Ferruginibacter sp.]
MFPLLDIQHLQVSFNQDGTVSHAVKDSSFTLPRGKMTAIVGESGSGKSVTALSLLKLLPVQAHISGNIFFSPDGARQFDINALNSRKMQDVRGNAIAMIFQEPMTSLNPVYTCGEQVMETIIRHKKVSRKIAREQTLALFELVALPNPAAMLTRYPHQISGGQKQRVMMAIAMSCDPDLLIADEPTTALDVRVQKNILQLIRNLQEKRGMSVLLITHDLALVSDFADNVIVMYKGEIVETGETKKVLGSPRHPYTKALLACRPAGNTKEWRLPVISDFIPAKENPYQPVPASRTQPNENNVVLSVENLSVHFPERKNIFGKTISVYKAVDDVSFNVFQNETLGLVGESGCGKTTLGRAILHLVKPTSGRILLEGKDIARLDEKSLRLIRKELQIVFQDPYGSLNPRISIGEAILEPLTVHGLLENKNQRREKVVELLEKVNLSADHFSRYPHQFSGGQRQRICIARALALTPSFLVFDESVSALDVSVQAQVLNLINDLKADLNFTAIFISHDLSVVHYISDRILVMNKGRIVESGSADGIYLTPKEEYTKQLIAAIPGRR